MSTATEPCEPVTTACGRVVPIESESIDAGTAWDIRPTLACALYSAGPDLCVDMTCVRFIDSAGLGMLLGLLREAGNAGGSLRLVNVRPEVQRTLQITGTDALLLPQNDRDRFKLTVAAPQGTPGLPLRPPWPAQMRQLRRTVVSAY